MTQVIQNVKSGSIETDYGQVCMSLGCDSKATRLIEIPIYGHGHIKEMKFLVCDNCHRNSMIKW